MICISYTGRTNAIVDVAATGRKTGAEVISITAPDSPLARNSHRVLAVAPSEDTEQYTPMSSRIAQLVIIDVLATRLALTLGEGFSEHLRRVKDVLANTRL